MLRLGTASVASGPRVIEVPTGAYQVHTTLCPDLAPNGQAYSACAKGRSLWLGRNDDQTENVDWKFVVAHELGHSIQDALSGVPGDSTAYNGYSVIPECNCDYIPYDNDKTHCMQSQEIHMGAEAEGFAHYAAANTWNGRSATSCKFVYYKKVWESSTLKLDPPFAMDCQVQARWLETRCLAAGRGVEWDWMNWKRNVDTAPASERTSFADMADIYSRACSGSCTTKTATPAQLIAAAEAKYGATSVRANRFRAALTSYGANH